MTLGAEKSLWTGLKSVVLECQLFFSEEKVSSKEGSNMTCEIQPGVVFHSAQKIGVPRGEEVP